MFLGNMSVNATDMTYAKSTPEDCKIYKGVCSCGES